MRTNRPDENRLYDGATRDGRPVEFCVDEALPAPFKFAGRINRGPLELWQFDGFWRESHEPHPNDIVRMDA